MKTGPTGGKAGHEDVEIRAHVDHFVLDFIMDFDAFAVEGTDVRDSITIAAEKLAELLRIGKFLHVGFVETLAKLSPHAIEHEFGHLPPSWIIGNVMTVELNVFTSQIVGHVLVFLLVGETPLRKSAGLFLDFEPGVYVVAEETLTFFLKPPQFVNGDEVIVFVSDGFLQFRRAPRAGDLALFWGVRTEPPFVQQRSVDVGLGTGTT